MAALLRLQLGLVLSRSYKFCGNLVKIIEDSSPIHSCTVRCGNSLKQVILRKGLCEGWTADRHSRWSFRSVERKEKQMNQAQEFSWWKRITPYLRMNPIFLVVSILVFILAFISIIVDDVIARGPGAISLWEWLGVLIIPLALLAAGILLHNEQIRYESIAKNQLAQDEALRQYLDQMSALMIDEGLRKELKNSDARLLAQARTTALLLELDDTRKRRPLKLVYRLHLINKPEPILTLENAALDSADLSEITLHDACLKGIDLRNADLSGANLRRTDLSDADLRGADLQRANLSDANLSRANLLPYDEQYPAKLNSFNLNGVDPNNIDLRSDILRVTNLSGANLEGVNLTGANLAYANLESARGMTTEELEQQANSLKDATMPDGSKHE
jgi:uncharacterized protein YjbI with pentapeptide repeats